MRARLRRRVYWPRIRIVYLVSLVCSLTPSDPIRRRREEDRPRKEERIQKGEEKRSPSLSIAAVVFVVSLHATQRPFAEGDSDTMGAEERRGDRGGEILKGAEEAGRKEPYE